MAKKTSAAESGAEGEETTEPGIPSDVEQLWNRVQELDSKATGLELRLSAVRQGLIDLAALLRNAGPPTKGALECVKNTLAQLEPAANG